MLHIHSSQQHKLSLLASLLPPDVPSVLEGNNNTCGGTLPLKTLKDGIF